MEMEDEEIDRFNGLITEEEKGQIGYNRKIENYDLYDEEGNKLVKICKICGKRFSSGRALGGHTRIHFAQPKPDPMKIVFINPKKKTTLLMNHGGAGGDNNEKQKTKNECLCCHKSFDSQKALYGHMRSHPEREYRGVVPPPPPPPLPPSPPLNRNNNSLSNNSTLSQDEVLNNKIDDDDDLVKGCDDDSVSDDTPLRWQCKGKRGRKGTLVVMTNSSGFCSSVSSSEDEDERRNAVLILMSLRLGDANYDGDNADDDFRTKKKHRQMKKLRDLDEARASPSNHGDRYKCGPSNHGQYKCSTCNKSFPTHQALGGHRSSHRKPVGISESKAKELKVDGAAEVQAETETGPHQCKLCGKIFETGQALGGHMRFHRTNYTDDHTLIVEAPSGESSQQQAVAAQDARVMLSFDLNEPAFVDGEDM